MDELSATENARDIAQKSATDFAKLATNLYEALGKLVREIQRKVATGSYDDEAGLAELVNSVEMLNAEYALEQAG